MRSDYSKIVFGISAVTYFLIGLFSGFFGWRNSDTEWLVAVASYLFTFDPYSYYRLIGIAPPLGAGYIFTPLLLFLISPFIALGHQVGWTNEFIARIYQLPLFLVDIFNIYLIIQLINYYRPKIPKSNINMIILVLFFSGFFLFTTGYMGHPETLVIFFSLLAIKSLRQKQYIKGGIFFGLALFTKQSSVFILIPIFFCLYLKQGGLQRLFKFLMATITTFLLLMAPFLITHSANTWYGVAGVTQSLIIWGPNIWWFIDAFSRIILHLSWVNQLLVKIANPVLLGLTILSSLIFLRHKKIKIGDPSLFGLISISFFLVNIFSKYLSFHHFLPGFVFVMIWDSIRRKEGFPIFGVTYAFILFVANFIGNPLWQLFILIINVWGFIYVWSSLWGAKAKF